METITREDFDNIVSHTIRIELKDGNLLILNVTVEAKKAFAKLLRDDVYSELENEFLWVYIPRDRLLLVNKNEIIRITFCFEPVMGEEPAYFDNFNVVDKTDLPAEINDDLKEENGEMQPYLPQLIIMHNRQMENNEVVQGVTMKTEGYFGNISTYSSLSSGDVDGISFEFFDDKEEWILLTYKYFQFIDDDGEENFMPFKNLSIIEIERPLLMSDESLNKYLGRKSKKQPKRKK